MPTNWKLQLPNLISKYFCSFHKTPRGCPTSDPNIYQRSRVKSNCSEKFILKREASLSTAEQHYWLDSLLHYPSTTGRCQSRLVNLMCAIPCHYGEKTKIPWTGGELENENEERSESTANEKCTRPGQGAKWTGERGRGGTWRGERSGQGEPNSGFLKRNPIFHCFRRQPVLPALSFNLCLLGVAEETVRERAAAS